MTAEDDAARARALESEASKCQREGRYADAEQPLLAAIEIWSRLFGPDDVEVLNDQMNRSRGVSHGMMRPRWDRRRSERASSTT
jgi:hypothetical protein